MLVCLCSPISARFRCLRPVAHTCSSQRAAIRGVATVLRAPSWFRAPLPHALSRYRRRSDCLTPYPPNDLYTGILGPIAVAVPNVWCHIMALSVAVEQFARNDGTPVRCQRGSNSVFATPVTAVAGTDRMRAVLSSLHSSGVASFLSLQGDRRSPGHSRLARCVIRTSLWLWS